MPIQHYDYKIVSKTKGHNLIAKVAYNSRKKVFDELEQKNKYPHASGKDHIETIILLPENAPNKYLNPGRLWNDVQNREKGRMAKNLIIAIPHEFIKRKGENPNDYDFSAGKQLITEHVQKEFSSKGYCCQIDFHLSYNEKGEPNFHAHILVSERQMVQGKWIDAKSHKVYLDENDNIIEPVQSPKLLFGKLMYDDDNNIIMEPGYKILQYDNDGKPLVSKRGYPVTKDIRVPIVSKRKDGKAEWKESKTANTSIDKINNLKELRKRWQNHQNEFYRRYNIRSSDGNIFQADHRPFNEKYAHLEELARPEPTKHIGYGKKRDYLIAYNESVMERRQLLKTIKEKATNLQVNKTTYKKNNIKQTAAMIHEEDDFYADLNPRRLWIKCWKNEYDNMMSIVKNHDEIIMTELQNSININRIKCDSINKNTRHGRAEYKRLQRHKSAMVEMYNRIKLFHLNENNLDIETLAGQAYDCLTNQQKVAFVRDHIGYNASAIMARVLDRRNNDGVASASGNIIETPYYPIKNTNDKLLADAVKMCSSKYFFGADEGMIAHWKEHPGDAPPAGIAYVINTYHTALQNYSDCLHNTDWSVRSTIDLKTYDKPNKINEDYNYEIKYLDIPKEKKHIARERTNIKRTEDISKNGIHTSTEHITPDNHVFPKNEHHIGISIKRKSRHYSNPGNKTTPSNNRLHKMYRDDSGR